MTLSEREEYARQASEYLDLHITTVIDSMDDYVSGLYGGWPLRLFLIGEDGNVFYLGGRGPAGYDPAELERAIRDYTGLDGVTSASAASFRQTHTAPGALASLFGEGLSTVTESATSVDPPVTLGGVTVRVEDSAGGEHQARLLAVTPNQINYEVPESAALGPAVVTVRLTDGSERQGPLLIKESSPGIFTANRNGSGVAAAHAVHIAEDDAQVWEEIAHWDSASNSFTAIPIEFRPGDRSVALVLYGTGLARASAIGLKIGSLEATVLWFGEHPVYPGLDQINIVLPPELAGSGLRTLRVTAGGEDANHVTVSF